MRLPTCAGERRSECSQTCITLQPRARRTLEFCLSRLIFRRIFSVQYSMFRWGIEKQRGQACQKHPSTKIANLSAGNAKSGFPGIGKCRRQPFKPSSFRRPRTTFSVLRFPLLLIAAMFLDRAVEQGSRAGKGSRLLMVIRMFPFLTEYSTAAPERRSHLALDCSIAQQGTKNFHSEKILVDLSLP